ncbi:hypothetical protein quinque_002296 [Culex quinquefasciatus]
MMVTSSKRCWITSSSSKGVTLEEDKPGSNGGSNPNPPKEDRKEYRPRLNGGARKRLRYLLNEGMDYEQARANRYRNGSVINKNAETPGIKEISGGIMTVEDRLTNEWALQLAGFSMEILAVSTTLNQTLETETWGTNERWSTER